MLLEINTDMGHFVDAPIQFDQKAWESPSGNKGNQILTQHFDLRVTAQDQVLVDYLPAFMETTFAEYAKLIPPEKPSSDRLVVYLFDTRNQWADFTRDFAPAQSNTYLHLHSGGYTDYPSATAVAYDLRRDRTLSLLAHEGMHQYLARYFSEPVIPWLNEGLACQWEAFELHGDRPFFTPHRNFLRRNHLREALTLEKGLIPLPQLLRMDAGEAVRQSGQPTRTYYAQVWSLVLFLREAYPQQLAALLADAGTPRLTVAIRAYRAATKDADTIPEGEVIFRQYITEDLDPFASAYQDYVRQLLN
jgi:hypothetical protein